MARLLIAGCGYVGTAAAERLAAAGHEVWGLRRRADQLPAPIRPLAADLCDPRSLASLPPGLDAVAYTTAADGSGPDAYRAAYVTGLVHLLAALAEQGQRPRRLVLTSSTSVYAQAAGEWVDETSPAQADTPTARILLESERVAWAAPCEAVVLRLSGLYGPGRTRVIESVRAGSARLRAGPPLFTNRVHRDDAAAAVAHLLLAPRVERLYLGTDDEPADQNAVLCWLAARLGVPPPPTEPAGPDAPPGTGPVRRSGSKRCSNARLKASGLALRYPTFRDGYAALFAWPA